MMKFKKLMAAVLSGAMLFGMTASVVPAPVVAYAVEDAAEDKEEVLTYAAEDKEEVLTYAVENEKEIVTYAAEDETEDEWEDKKEVAELEIRFNENYAYLIAGKEYYFCADAYDVNGGAGI